MKTVLSALLVPLAIVSTFLFEPQSAEAPTREPEKVAVEAPAEPKYHELTIPVVTVIIQKETGGSSGCVHTAGASGEKGCFQFMPSTWRGYSKEVFGKVVEMNAENELAVVTAKVDKWLEHGYTPRQIFLIWQQGNASPCKKGVNKYGVAFDSCAYAQDGVNKLALILAK